MLVDRSELLIYLRKAGSATDQDNRLIDMLQPYADAAIYRYLQREIQLQRYVEYYPLGQQQIERGNLADIQKVNGRVIFIENRRATEGIVLRNPPVMLSSLEVREQVGAYAGQGPGAFADGTQLVIGTDYWLDDDIDGVSHTGVIYRNGTWPTQPRSVKVTYLGGLTESQLRDGITASVRYAALLTWVKAVIQANAWAKRQGVVTSFSMGKYSQANHAEIQAMMTGMTVSVPYEAQEALQQFRSYAIFGPT